MARRSTFAYASRRMWMLSCSSAVRLSICAHLGVLGGGRQIPVILDRRHDTPHTDFRTLTIGVDDPLGRLRGLVGGREAGHLLDLAGAGPPVEAFDVAPHALLER